MPATQREVFETIVRLTYGDRNRTQAVISVGRLEKATGRARSGVKAALHDLIQENVITVVVPSHTTSSGGLSAPILAVQKDYEDWGKYTVHPSDIPAFLRHDWEGYEGEQGDQSEQGHEGEPPSVSGVNAGVHHGEQNRATTVNTPKTRHGRQEDSPMTVADPAMDLAVEDDDDRSFDLFWAFYPRHEDRKGARTAWQYMKKADRELAIGVAQVMRALFDAGQKEKKYIPMPTTFIHKERWMDWSEGVPAGWQDESDARAAQQQATIDEAIARVYEQEGA